MAAQIAGNSLPQVQNKPGEITEEVRRVDENTTVLSQKLEDLIQMLSPILAPENAPSNNTGPSGIKNVQSSMGADLNLANERLSAIHTRLNELRSRVRI
jgi:hypothetical protein